MGFFSLLFGPSNYGKKIYRKEFNDILRSIPDISLQDREYLNKVFSDELSGGLYASELKRQIQSLIYKTDDRLRAGEVEKVKRKILAKKEPKIQEKPQEKPTQKPEERERPQPPDGFDRTNERQNPYL